MSDRRESSPIAESISAMLTLYRRASALRLGSRQPGSRCTRAAAIRSASTPPPARCSGTSASTATSLRGPRSPGELGPLLGTGPPPVSPSPGAPRDPIPPGAGPVPLGTGPSGADTWPPFPPEPEVIPHFAATTPRPAGQAGQRAGHGRSGSCRALACRQPARDRAAGPLACYPPARLAQLATCLPMPPARSRVTIATTSIGLRLSGTRGQRARPGADFKQTTKRRRVSSLLFSVDELELN